MAKNYQGTSITDFLKSTGVASDFSSRATLAQQQGITGYTGSSNQNTQLLGLLNSGNLPPKTITTDALGTQPKIVLPGATNPINPLLGTIAGQVEGAVSGLAQIEADRLSADKNKQEGGISDLIKEMGIISGSEKTIAAGLGAETAQLEINRLSKDLIGEQRAFELQKRDIEARNPGGLFGGAQKDLINNLERASLQKQADIAILKAGAQGDYETANKIAKDRVDAEIAPMQAELDAKKFIYDNNKDLFSAAQKNKLETLQKADQAKLDEIKKTKEESGKMYINALQGKAPQSILNKAQDAINQGKSVTEVAGILGNYSMSEGDRLDLQLKKAQISNINSQISERNKNQTGESATEAKERQDKEKSEAQKKAQVPIIKEKIDLIASIFNSSGLNTRVGPSALGLPTRKFFGLRDSFGAGQDFASSVQQLTNQDTLATLLELKAAGGTLGAISEKELDLLQKAASKINAWEVKGKDGIGKGQWNISEKKFKDELDILKSSSQALYESLGGAEAEQGQLNGFLDIVDGALQSSDSIYSQSGYSL